MMCAAFTSTSTSSTTHNQARRHYNNDETMMSSSSTNDDTVMASSTSLSLSVQDDTTEQDVTAAQSPSVSAASTSATAASTSASASSAAAAAAAANSSFPLKLHAMLNDIERRQSTFAANSVSWQEGGKSFKVHDVEHFATHVLPRYFNQTKFKSFQRQLNMYGFRRIQHGKLKGGYVHKSFVRGKPQLSNGVTRRTHNQTNSSRKMAVAAKVVELVAKASAAAAANNTDGAPVSVADLFDDTPIQDYMSSVDFGEDFNMSVLEDIFREETGGGDSNGKDDTTPISVSSLSLPQAIAASSNPEMAAAVVQEATEAVYRRIENMDDFLSDDSSHDENDGDEVDREMSEIKTFLRNLLDDTVDDEEKVTSLLSQPASSAPVVADPAGGVSTSSSVKESAASSISPHEDPIDSSSFSDEDKETEEQLSERVFPLKLHKMLQNAHRDGIAHIVSWVDDGKGFKVYNSDAFTKQVMPLYFDQTKYESFRRQLNLYGFTRVSRGPRRGIYSHPMFVAGNRPLVISGVRRKLPNDVNGVVNNKAGGDGGEGTNVYIDF